MRRSRATSAPMQISYDVCVPYLLMHLACFGVLWTGVTWSGIAICLASFYIRQLGLGIGLHRYFAHRSFRTSRVAQLFLALLCTLSMQRGVLWWAQTHRHHHRHADTPEDLHSPLHHGFFYAHCGWFMDRKNYETDLSKVPDLARFRELVWLDDWRVYMVPMVAYGWALYAFFGWGGVVWGIAISTVLLWHGTHWLQSMSHSHGGYRRLESADYTRNHFWFGVVTLGEFHNNHHALPSSCRQGFARWEIDIQYHILQALSWAGLVWDLKTPRIARPAPRAQSCARPNAP